jgi:hypothetical protein
MAMVSTVQCVQLKSLARELVKKHFSDGGARTRSFDRRNPVEGLGRQMQLTRHQDPVLTISRDCKHKNSFQDFIGYSFQLQATYF